jgi:uncharacterized repeat protein (TIGR03843 family)
MHAAQDSQSTSQSLDETASEKAREISLECTLTLLAEGEMKLLGLLPGSSNYTFLAHLSADTIDALAVYKPQRGERPLWDFADGTLCLREVAAFLLSQVLGWPRVPPTVLRQGPHGLGAVQLYVDADPDAHYLTFAQKRPAEGQHIALFDFIANNADRKSGHCLLDSARRVWCIDHGITFHADYKLRTVIWEFGGQPIPATLLDDLRALESRLAQTGPETEGLARLLSPREMDALRQRLDYLLTTKTFPEPGPYRAIPWPPV